MKTLVALLFASCFFITSCASYPNYYIKDSTITTQQTTQTYQQSDPYYGYAPAYWSGCNNPVYYVPPGWGWNGAWADWYGFGNCW